MDINRPEILAEVASAFACYEAALAAADAAVLDGLFWNNAATIRYGVAEMLTGHGEIAAFNAARLPQARTLRKTVITTYGRDAATASTLFDRPSSAGQVGRQMQTWIRMPEGWRVVAAHVSMIPRGSTTGEPAGPP